MKKYLILIFLLFVFTANVFATLTSKAIDTPINSFYSTDEFCIDYYMYKNGGMVTWVEMGIKSSLNLGFSVDFNNMIGDKNMKTEEPKISVRWRVYRGDLYFPAMYMGYLGQTYGKNIDGSYEMEEKGFFIGFERELFLPALMFNFGVNMAQFDVNKTYGFANFRYLWLNKLMIMLEYDNIRTAPNARLNFGLRYFIVDNLSMGIGIRKLNKLSEQTVERVFMITYVGEFDFFNK